MRLTEVLARNEQDYNAEPAKSFMLSVLAIASKKRHVNVQVRALYIQRLTRVVC